MEIHETFSNENEKEMIKQLADHNKKYIYDKIEMIENAGFDFDVFKKMMIDCLHTIRILYKYNYFQNKYYQDSHISVLLENINDADSYEKIKNIFKQENDYRYISLLLFIKICIWQVNLYGIPTYQSIPPNIEKYDYFINIHNPAYFEHYKNPYDYIEKNDSLSYDEKNKLNEKLNPPHI